MAQSEKITCDNRGLFCVLHTRIAVYYSRRLATAKCSAAGAVGPDNVDDCAALLGCYAAWDNQPAMWAPGISAGASYCSWDSMSNATDGSPPSIVCDADGRLTELCAASAWLACSPLPVPECTCMPSKPSSLAALGCGGGCWVAVVAACDHFVYYRLLARLPELLRARWVAGRGDAGGRGGEQLGGTAVTSPVSIRLKSVQRSVSKWTPCLPRRSIDSSSLAGQLPDWLGNLTSLRTLCGPPSLHCRVAVIAPPVWHRSRLAEVARDTAVLVS